jgi:hypothetical protein
MRALVVYESMYGNTREIAEAIATGLAEAMTVEVVEVGVAPPSIGPEVDLLVVGGPTHAHGMSKPDSRRTAARNASRGLASNGIGIREWLDGLRPGTIRAAAAFDTRIKGPGLLWGSAARGAHGALHRLGARAAAGPESFLVDGPTGPTYDRLLDGEVERARTWGRELGGRVAAPAAATAAG